MPAEASGRVDEWAHLDSPEAAAAAIEKLEALGRSVAETSARKRYMDLLDIRSGQSVIDVGAGTGIAAIEMARRVGRGGRIVALDPSVRLGSYGREAAASAGVADIVAWRTGCAEALPFSDGTFDRSFCHWLLLHVDDAGAVVREMRRVTRTGGRVMGVEVDWETVTVHPGERTLTRRILNFSSDRHVEGWSGRRVAPLFRDCGIAEVFVRPVVTVDGGHEGLQWVRFLHQRAAMALAAAVVSDVEASEWLDAIDRAVARRRYFFSLTQFVVWGEVS